MLLENLWTQCGLANGAIGTIMDVIWHPSVTNSRESPPFALLIHFDTYKGPEFCTVNGKKVVPIFRSKRDFSIWCRIGPPQEAVPGWVRRCTQRR